MKAKDYRLHRSMGERIIRLIEGNDYVQMALLIIGIILVGNILPIIVHYINYVRWGMTM